MSFIKNIVIRFIIVVITLNLVTSCQSEDVNDPYTQVIKKWREDRVSRLKQPESWLSLVGLHWLKEGENKFGSDNSNNIIFIKKAPAFIGSFYLKDSIVTVKINDNVEVFNDSIRVSERQLKDDLSGDPTILRNKSLSWYVIKRAGDKYGIRVKDSENSLIKNFRGIDSYPVKKDWLIQAEFAAYDPPKKVIIPNIIGTAEEDEAPGKLIFKIDGNQYSLDVLDSGNRFFVIFADMTNGEETYGAGRFLSVDKPDSTGTTLIDFNKAYNPPCAFTKYATCPLPPKDNMLKVAIEAGEKNFGEGH